MNRCQVRSLALVVKKGNAAAEKVAEELKQWLKDRNTPFSCCSFPDDDLSGALSLNPDLVLVLGGDGTLVSVARRIVGRSTPLAGINFGRVGFLAELSADSWHNALAGALEQGIAVEKRMALNYSLFRGERHVRGGWAANDVVVTRGRVARLVNLRLNVDGAPLAFLRSDGLVISTPVGSTGYAGSAGGPLVYPGINAYIVAAVCPYLGSFPPLVLKPETVFSIEIGEAVPDLYLTLDGQEAYALDEGDRLEVYGEPESISMADFGQLGYFERLRQVGFVRDSGVVPDKG